MASYSNPAAAAEDLQTILNKLTAMGTDPALLAAISQSLPSSSNTPSSPPTTTKVTPPPSPKPEKLIMVPYTAPSSPTPQLAPQNPNPKPSPTAPTVVSSNEKEEVQSSPTHPTQIEEETEEFLGEAATATPSEKHATIKQKIQGVVRSLAKKLYEDAKEDVPPKVSQPSGRVKMSRTTKRRIAKVLSLSSDEDSEPLSRHKAKKAKVSPAPVRKSQRRQTAKTKAKAETDEVKDISHKSVVKELLVDPEFLKENALEEVSVMLDAQKWGDLFVHEEEIDEVLLREFYSTFVIEVRSHAVLGSYKMGGTVHRFSSIELGVALRVPHEGYDGYPKGRWPKDFPYNEAVRAVAGVQDPPESRGFDTSEMSAVNKVLFHYLICNVIPRGQKRNKLLILDVVLLSLLLKREPICLPKLMMQHMAYARNTDQHALPFPRVVKKILEYHKVYNSSAESSVFSRPLDISNLHKMQFILQEGEGWVKVGSVPVISEVHEDSEDAVSEGEQKEKSDSGKDLRSLCRAVTDLAEQQRLLMADVRALIALHSSASTAGPSGA